MGRYIRGTFWLEDKLVLSINEDNSKVVCTIYDQFSQPYLANPRNQRYVEKYIYWELPM